MRAMDPLEILRREHELILSALTTLVRLAGRIGAGERPRRNFDRLIDFFEHFADGCHHAKEEQLLFPALIEAGLPGDDGPLLVLSREHEAARRLLAHLRATLDDLGDKHRRNAFVDAVEVYVDLVTQHVEKENRVLFRAAERLLDDDARAVVGAEFASFSGERAGGQGERWKQIVRQIAQEAVQG